MRSERATRRAEGTSCESTNSVERIVIHSNPQRQSGVPAHWILLARQPTARAEASVLIPLIPSRVNFATIAQPIVSTPSEMLKAVIGAD